MVEILAIFLVSVPAVAVLYPFLRRFLSDELVLDESSPELHLKRSWEVALSGIKNIELEWSIGNLSTEDYIFLRRKCILDVAMAMQNMELREDEKLGLLKKIKQEIQKVKLTEKSPDIGEVASKCSSRSSQLDYDETYCGKSGNVKESVGNGKISDESV